MRGSVTLQEYLEEYIKREGLYSVILEHRRRVLFTLPLALIWLVGLWGLAAFFLLQHRGLGGLPMAIIGPPLLLAVTLIALVIYYVVRQFRSNAKLSSEDAGTIGGFYLLGFPILMAAALGIYLGSWIVTALYVVLCAVGIAVFLLLQQQRYRVYLLIELVRSMIRAFWQSMTLLLVLVPLLLVVVLLSIFSQELWEALGRLSPTRLISSVFIMILPAFLFVLASLKRRAREIVGEFPEADTILEKAQRTAFIKSKLDRGLISAEEWMGLRDELMWRHLTRLGKSLLPTIQNRVRRWLFLLLGLTSLALTIFFFVYFFVFFTVLLEPPLVAAWTGVQLDTLVVPLNLIGYSLDINLPTTAVPVTKVSLLLAVFVAAMFSVYSLTDETFRKLLTEWLSNKAASWIAASSLYLCATSPGYQVWEYVVRDKRKGIANVSIVVPSGLSEEMVEAACQDMESRLQEYTTLVLITAFEQNPERPIYKRGMPGNRWELLHNKTKGIRSFRPIPLELDENRYQHFLGVNCLREGTEIPDDWFGNTPQGIALGKWVWEDDESHNLVLHPYVYESDVALTLEIQLAKRIATSNQYRECIRKVLSMARQRIPDARTIWIEVCFRDTLETLARLNWSQDLPYVEYKDEIICENRIEEPSDWN